MRYADDCNVYVRSRRAGARVMAALERMYAKLRLRVNREEEQGGTRTQPAELQLLVRQGWNAVMCRVAPEAARALKQRVRQITRCSGGRSLRTVVAELRGSTCRGGSNTSNWRPRRRFSLNTTNGSATGCERCNSNSGSAAPEVYAELRELGVPIPPRRVVAANPRRWWRNARMLVQLGLLPATTTASECPDLPDNLNHPNRRMRTRMSGGVAGE